MTIAADLGSLDGQKRERACVILGNILANYSSNFQYFNHLCTTDLLGKLCMRLVDSSHTVRLHAAGAVRNMTSSKFPVIAQRMIDAGIISTMITLVNECIATPSVAASSYAEQLVTAISNLWSTPSFLINFFRSDNPQCCM
jgi:tRNA A37 threonylcarbamoyladenosine synthetase subunit TsaC/SUA5/YrdC